MATYRIMHLKDFVWCRHPGCESGQIHLRGSNDDDNKMVCHKCGNLTCVDCDTSYFPLHRTKDCATIAAGLKKKKEAEDQGTAGIIAETSNICPTCGASIQKISGCDFMQCKLISYPQPHWCLLTLLPQAEHALERLHGKGLRRKKEKTLR